jgi:hypothetical protein
MSNYGEAVMPGDIDLSPKSKTSRIQSENNNYKKRNTNGAGYCAFFYFGDK